MHIIYITYSFRQNTRKNWVLTGEMYGTTRSALQIEKLHIYICTIIGIFT